MTSRDINRFRNAVVWAKRAGLISLKPDQPDESYAPPCLPKRRHHKWSDPIDGICVECGALRTMKEGRHIYPRGSQS